MPVPFPIRVALLLTERHQETKIMTAHETLNMMRRARTVAAMAAYRERTTLDNRQDIRARIAVQDGRIAQRLVKVLEETEI